MPCTKQVMTPGGLPGDFNCRTLLLKIILPLLDKSLHTTMIFSMSLSVQTALKKKGTTKQNLSFLSPSFSASLSGYILHMFGKKVTIVRFPLIACLLANLARVLKVRITSQLFHTFQTGTLTSPDHTVTGILPAFLPPSLQYLSKLQPGAEGKKGQG